jgi:hypothetical protein
MAKKRQIKPKKDTAKERTLRKKNTKGDVGITLPLPSPKSELKGIDLKEYPDVYKYYNNAKEQLSSNGKLEKHLLLINDIENKTKDIAEGLQRRLSDIIPLEKIKHIDCLNKNERLSEMFTNISNLDKTTLVLHGFGKRDYDVLLTTFAEYAEWVDNNVIPPFIVACLIKGENVLKEYKCMFKVVSISSQTKKQGANLKKGGKGNYLSDEKLKPLLKQILKEYKDSAYKLPDLAEIAHKQIKEKYGLRRREKDFKLVDYYSKSKLKMFLSRLRNTGKLR